MGRPACLMVEFADLTDGPPRWRSRRTVSGAAGRSNRVGPGEKADGQPPISGWATFSGRNLAAMTAFLSTTISLRHLVGSIRRGDIALPELQRPLVSSNAKVRAVCTGRVQTQEQARA